MFNLMSKKWKVAVLTSALVLLGVCLYTCANSQVRITAQFGMTSKVKSLAGASVGYDFKDVVSIQSGFLSAGLQQGVYHGITAGPIVGDFVPYVGFYRLSIGHQSSQDRYVHNGVEEILYKDNKIDSWAYPIGLQWRHNMWFGNAGYIIGDVNFMFVTVGMSYLFRK